MAEGPWPGTPLRAAFSGNWRLLWWWWWWCSNPVARYPPDSSFSSKAKGVTGPGEPRGSRRGFAGFEWLVVAVEVEVEDEVEVEVEVEVGVGAVEAREMDTLETKSRYWRMASGWMRREGCE